MLLHRLLLCTAALAGGILPAAAAAQRPAKVLFGMTSTPAPMAARAIGSYTRGCLAGGVQLPSDGPAWQAMRLSRNRTWGTPLLVNYVERLAKDARTKDGWPGLLVGDLAQPRGGPMLTGHASHQIGLDGDIWLTPMPDRKLSSREREDKAATSMLAADGMSVDPKLFTVLQGRLLRRAASYPQVARIFVHPAIKKALCDMAGEIDPQDRSWLRVVRPWWGHFYHFHVRLDCPAGMAGCVGQAPLPPGDGCGKEVESWLSKMRPKKEVATAPKPTAKAVKKPALTLAQLPAACATVLAAGYPDGLKRFNVDLAEDIEAPTRNPRRLTAVAAAMPGIATAPATPVAAAAVPAPDAGASVAAGAGSVATAVPAAPAATAVTTAAAASPAAAPAKVRFAPAQMIPGMSAAQRFSDSFTRPKYKPKAQAEAKPPVQPQLQAPDQSRPLIGN
jgi:penicillin-insensitive murein endopeptidase